MEFIKKLKYLSDISGIPISMCDEQNEIKCFPEMPYLKRIITGTPPQYFDKDRHVDCFLTDELLCYGYIHVASYGWSLIVGPVKALDFDNRRAQRILKSYGLPTTEAGAFMSYLQGTPTCSLSRFAHFLVFFHYVINGEEIDIKEMLPFEYFFEEEPNQSDKAPDRMPHNAQEYENHLYSMLRFGQYEKMREFFKGNASHVHEGSLAEDILRHQKNLIICSTTIAARSAVQGGLEYEAAMSLADQYIQKVELAPNRATLASLHKNMLLAYTKMVSEKKMNNANAAISARVRTYVEERLTEKITSQDIADALRLSRSYLSSQFKKETGTNLNDFITQLKLDEAKRLLLTTKQTAADIATLLEFCTQSHFQTVFKKHVGMSPKAFREKGMIAGV